MQDLRYGAESGQIWFRAFDIWTPQGFLDPPAFRLWCEDFLIPTVPFLYTGAYDPAAFEEMSRMDKSSLADHLAEGVVIKPARERVSHSGRVALKLVSDAYLARA